MTYNFDPDRWYDNERAALEAALRAGSVSKDQFRIAAAVLEERYEKMWQRLDGTYQLPQTDNHQR